MEGSTTVKAAFIIIILSIFSKVFGLFRDVALAGVFGASFETDAYLIATLIPNLLFATVGAAIVTTFIPLYSELDEKKDYRERDTFVATFFKIILLISLLLSVFGVIFAPGIVSLMAPGFSGEVRELTILLTRIMMPVIVFLGGGGVAKGILNYNKDFHTPSMVGIFQNIIIIFFILVLGTTYGITFVTIGTLIGFSMNFWVLLPKLYKLKAPVLKGMDLYHPKIKTGLYLILPILLGNAVIQINELIDRMLASNLPEGSVSALNFASKVFILPHGIFVLAIVTALYPSMSKYASQQRYDELKKLLRQGLSAITFIILPVMILTIFFREEIILLLFERGQFDEYATGRTATALFFYSFGMLAISINEILKRTFYSKQDTRTPVLVTTFTVGVNIVLNLLLIGPLGHGGLALATSIAVFSGTILLLWGLRKNIGPFGFSEYVKSFAKILISAILMGGWLLIGLYYLEDVFPLTFMGIASKVLIISLVGGLIYTITAKILGSAELDYLQELALRYLKK